MQQKIYNFEPCENKERYFIFEQNDSQERKYSYERNVTIIFVIIIIFQNAVKINEVSTLEMFTVQDMNSRYLTFGT